MWCNLHMCSLISKCVKQTNSIRILSSFEPFKPRFTVNNVQRFQYNLNSSNTKNGEGKNPGDVKRMKMYKLLFSSILFGSTLALALYVKRKRSSELRNLLSEARRLPIDNNYHSSEAQHMYLYNGFILNLSNLKTLQNMSNKFIANSDDVYVVSFPKAGTTWVQEIVYLIGTDLNYEKASSAIMETRFPYLEYVYPGWQSVNKMTSKRYIKSHLPYSLLPKDIKDKNCKIIYIARNPKDVVVSYYFYVRMFSLANYRGTFKEFFDNFLKNEVFYAPFWNHIFEFWNRKEEDNILFIKYEDMQKDLEKEIKRISNFMGKGLCEEDVQKLAQHVSFDEMAINSAVNYSHWDDLGIRNKDEARFFRKGKTGDWKNYFTEEMNSRFNTWIKENTKNTDITFDYD